MDQETPKFFILVEGINEKGEKVVEVKPYNSRTMAVRRFEGLLLHPGQQCYLKRKTITKGVPIDEILNYKAVGLSIKVA